MSDPVKALREAVAEYDRLRACPDPDSRSTWVELDDDDARALLALIEVGEEWSNPATAYGYDLEGFEMAWRAAKEGR
jgi:hypothetical protein